MKRFLISILMVMFVFVFSLSGHGQASVKEYRVPMLMDFSGPYAEVNKWHAPPKDVIIKWWNETEGIKLGVKIVPKTYDTRYDGALVASIWPGILSELSPIVALGQAGPDATALMQRLPKDKVPMIWPTGAYGFNWLPDQWTFFPRSTNVHEFLGILCWYIDQHPEKRPVRVATMTTQLSPSSMDTLSGFKHYFKNILEPKGLAKIVAQEWIDLQPVDVSSQMKSIIDAKVDILWGVVNSATAVAYIRAQQLYNVSIPTFQYPVHTIWPYFMANKTFKPWEGHYVGAGQASVTEKDSKAHHFYEMLQEKYGLKVDLSPLNMDALGQTLLMLRAVERAAKKVGGANLTGQAIYDAMFAGTFTEEELMGVYPGLRFTKEQPFPIPAKLKIETVKDGKYQLATPGWVPVPADLTKW